jgi:hypothetical protein
MGVGNNPHYFAERGYYLAYERQMLDTFGREGFTFAPRVMPPRWTMEFLQNKCGVSRDQALLRCRQHDVLVIERIDGIMFATQTGDALDYEADIAQFDADVLEEAISALSQLRESLRSANAMGLFHNDAMPGNIVFTVDSHGRIAARLLDFELAQDLWTGSPAYVNSSVQELYDLRGVPRDEHVGTHTMTLDDYLLEASARALQAIRQTVVSHAGRVTASVPFIGGARLRAASLLQAPQRG